MQFSVSLQDLFKKERPLLYQYEDVSLTSAILPKKFSTIVNNHSFLQDKVIGLMVQRYDFFLIRQYFVCYIIWIMSILFYGTEQKSLFLFCGTEYFSYICILKI